MASNQVLFLVLLSFYLASEINCRVVNRIQYFDGYSNNKFVSECRKDCLNKFSQEETNAIIVTDDCSARPNCFMCWDYCAVLYESRLTNVFDEICSDYFCFPGCKHACAFHLENEKYYPKKTSSNNIFDIEQPPKTITSSVNEIELINHQKIVKDKKSQTNEATVFKESSIVMEEDHLNNDMQEKTFHEVTLLMPDKDYVSDEQMYENNEEIIDYKTYDYIEPDHLNDVVDSMGSADYLLLLSKLQHINT